MIVNYWVGTVTSETILHWADLIKKFGRELIVFEIQDLDSILQNDFGELPPGLLMPEDL